MKTLRFYGVQPGGWAMRMATVPLMYWRHTLKYDLNGGNELHRQRNGIKHGEYCYNR